MKRIKFIFLTALFSTACILPAAAQNKVTGLSGVKLYIDPGHGGTDNMGMYNWSESEKVLRVGIYLEQYLLKYTDMQAQNFMFSRKADSDPNTALSSRTSESRTFGAKFYYSIHSDATTMGSATNRAVFLYGGRRLTSGGTVMEKLPEGGREFGNHLTRDMLSIMRVPSRNLTSIPPWSGGENGNVADLIYYSGTGTTPWLAVNNGTNTYIPSLLAEMGFHTSPEQNALNMSDGFMKALAYATYQSMVRYMTTQSWGGGSMKEPVQAGILHGFIVEEETNSPINGATITISKAGVTAGTYKTDSYDAGTRFSLKYPAGKGAAGYSFYTDVLRNGFYWIEDLAPGETYTVKVEAPGFDTKDNLSITIPTSVGAKTIDGLGVLDVKMKNLMPGIVLDNDIVNPNKVPLNKLIRITFSRSMNQSTVASAFKITKADGGAAAATPLSWQNGVLQADVSQLDFDTDYVLTIDGAIAKATGYDIGLDGARTGSISNYVVNFKTEAATPPRVVSYGPVGTEQFMLRPVVRIELDQQAQTSSIAGKLTVVNKQGTSVAGTQYYNSMGNGKSVFHYIFNADLTANERYTVKLAAGIKNVYGNATEEDFVFTFVPRNQTVTVNTPALNQFNGTEGSFGGGSQIGGIVANSYTYAQDATVKLTAQNANSHRVNYRWDESTDIGTTGDPRPGIRHHYGTTTPTFTSSAGTLQYWVFGDGSNSKVSVIIAPIAGGYVVKRTTVDWVGWKMLSWDLSSSSGTVNYLSGSSTSLSAASRFAGVNIVGPSEVADRDLNASSLWFSGMRLVTLGSVQNIFTVTFNTQGGSAVPSDYYTANVPMDILPTPPTRPGYSFAGWCKDADCAQSWDLATDVLTANTTLYAKWETLVESHSPTEGETNVSLRPVIRIEFREPLNPTSINEYQISVIDDGGAGTFAPGVLSYQTENEKGVLLFTLNNDLFAKTEYKVKLDPGYETALGIEMPDEISFFFTTGDATSIEMLKASSVLVYPNPTSGKLTLRFGAAGDYNVTVADVTGRNLLSQSTKGISMPMDISNYDAGIYLIIIDDGTKQTVMRVVKQ